MELKDRTALVTGANGFVGSFLVPRLLAEGMRVRALVREHAAQPLREQGVEVVLGDLTDAQAQADAVRGVDVVIHCAASGTADLDEARAVNVAASTGLAEAARVAGCERFIHVSTVAVYARHASDEAVREDAPLYTATDDAYALSKAEAEQAVAAAAARGLRAVILRPAVILGVHPTSYWGTRFPGLIELGQFAHVDEGRTRLGYVHIDNFIEAIVLALRSDDAATLGGVFNIVDGHRPWIDYTRHFSRGPLPSLPPEQAPAFLCLRGSYATDRAERLLGFVPRPDFDAYLGEILAARASRT